MNAVSHASVPTAEVTFLFSDVVGFTGLTRRLGDARALAVIDRHLATVRALLERHGGEQVELRGDGVLLAFDAPARAVRFARALLEAQARDAAERPDEAVRLRLGIHTGAAIPANGGYFGRAVIFAARIAARAEPDQILVSSRVVEFLGATREFCFGRGRALALKGFPSRHRVQAVERAAAPLEIVSAAAL
jgi:class 3 adenylate cyclase